MSSAVSGKPYIVITGGIASGKSTVSKMLADLGAIVISADQIARQVVEPGKEALKKIEEVFGSSIIAPSGKLDRAKLAEIVFTDAQARRNLEMIIHPLIKSELNRQIEDALCRTPFVAAEIPLYLEGGRRSSAAEVWVVYVDENTQIARLMERENLSRQQAEARLNAQMPLADKCRLADRVIDNSGSKKDTLDQVVEAVNAISWLRPDNKEP